MGQKAVSDVAGRNYWLDDDPMGKSEPNANAEARSLSATKSKADRLFQHER